MSFDGNPEKGFFAGDIDEHRARGWIKRFPGGEVGGFFDTDGFICGCVPSKAEFAVLNLGGEVDGATRDWSYFKDAVTEGVADEDVALGVSCDAADEAGGRFFNSGKDWLIEKG